MPYHVLELFDKVTARWFEKTLGSPTPVQEQSWPAIAAGQDTLVSAPTGTGKTLSAFLVFIDKFKKMAREGRLEKQLYLIYVSPLKSLAGDIRENLRRPLDGIYDEERLDGLDVSLFAVHTAMRTGDTKTSERQKMVKSPPHILITTPESLYLLLTSLSGQKMLKTAEAVIIDELHALIGSKRGAHLMLTLARLDLLCASPLQRIGLSATIEPLELAAQYLSSNPVTIIAPKMIKNIKIKVISPLAQTGGFPQGSIWPDIARAVYDHCEGARSVIAFCDGRLFVEKLAYYVNQIAGEGFACTHHGSVSKEQRQITEKNLKNGELRLLCATSSMELGIDVGEIDQVLQVGCPRSISSTMQRLGRAGHNPGRISVMYIFPKTSSEGLYCGLVSKVATEGGIEHSRPPRLCFDVLSQHLVSMAVGDGYNVDEVMRILPRAYPFKEVTKADVESILCMLAGDYEHERDIPVRPRILYDRIHERVEGDAYSRMLAVSTGGTIPDRGLFPVYAENGAKLGELDEEFVFEQRVGYKFLLGSFAWKFKSIQKDKVVVSQTNSEGAQPPFYKADPLGRTLQTSFAFGVILRELEEARNNERLFDALLSLGLDKQAALGAQDFLSVQIESTGVLPSDRVIIVEHFPDEAGDHQMMVHSMFGRQVNTPLCLLIHESAKQMTGLLDIGCFEDDDGFMLVPYAGHALPDRLLYTVDPDTALQTLETLLPSTPLFNINFRYNAARALLMGVKKAGRQPLWVQRLRGAEMLEAVIGFDDHPLIRETKRECLEDYWDIKGVEYVLRSIRSGAIQVREIRHDKASPMSLSLRRQAESDLLYSYTPTPSKTYKVVNDALKEALMPPAPEQLAKVSERYRLPENEKQLHSLLMIEGDLVAGELDVPITWLDSLARGGRALYIEPGLWIAAEHNGEYEAGLTEKDQKARKRIIRRCLRYRGAQTIDKLAERYFLTEEETTLTLKALCEENAAIEDNGMFYHAELFERARRETVARLRKQIKTLPAERYAAMLIERLKVAAPPEEQLETALKSLMGTGFSPGLWESMLLPARVTNYRPNLLDALLSQGRFVWNISKENGQPRLHFTLNEDADWDADMTECELPLEGDEKLIYDTLCKRGASFAQSLSPILSGNSPYSALLSLMENGIVRADSFIPVRQWLERDKMEKAAMRQRAKAKMITVTNGRWELIRPTKESSIEQKIDKVFDRFILLCRETAATQGLSWPEVLEIIRVWEYTGKVRRGYFIEGLSGAQFIRTEDFDSAVLAMEQPRDEIIWLCAADPLQPWGKIIPHKSQELSFLCVPGTAVALHAGVPSAVFEKAGQVLKVFDYKYLTEALQIFVSEYTRRRLFPSNKRILVKQYPEQAIQALENAGFSKSMLDYVIHQGLQ